MCVFLYIVPADFTRLEVTLDSYRLFSAEAAEVCVIVTDITLLILLDNPVSTDGLITDWPKRKDMQINTQLFTMCTVSTFGPQLCTPQQADTV